MNTHFSKHFFSGLLIINPKTGDTIINYNSKKYFTPASNVKIFTLYAAHKMLPKRTPVVKYQLKKDTVYIQGVGNPSLLHPYFKDSTLLHFLKPYKNIALFLDNYNDKKYGAGWAWDDYDWYYSPEINPLPLYGNIVSINNNNITPSYFKDSIVPIKSKKRRDFHKNLFYKSVTTKKNIEIPFITSKLLVKKLLENNLKKDITLIDKMPNSKSFILKGIPTDSLYKRMLHESDNFIAEQLLLMASSTLSDTLNGAKIRKHILNTYLSNLKQIPRWVDGSGLSRYNLFTPESIVHVLHYIYKDIPNEKLFSFFPAGGISGTLKNDFRGNSNPYIYAKSGSLSNNYCLSGYLLTKKGETFIFSFMNNHFREPSSKIKAKMETILSTVRDSY